MESDLRMKERQGNKSMKWLGTLGLCKQSTELWIWKRDGCWDWGDIMWEFRWMNDGLNERVQWRKDGFESWVNKEVTVVVVVVGLAETESVAAAVAICAINIPTAHTVSSAAGASERRRRLQRVLLSANYGLASASFKSRKVSLDLVRFRLLASSSGTKRRNESDVLYIQSRLRCPFSLFDNRYHSLVLSYNVHVERYEFTLQVTSL